MDVRTAARRADSADRSVDVMARRRVTALVFTAEVVAARAIAAFGTVDLVEI